MPSASQKPNPALKSAGMIRNIGNDGATCHKVARAWLANRMGSWVSRHSQIIPRTKINGSEAINAPMPALRRATSDAKAIRMPEIAALRRS